MSKIKDVINMLMIKNSKLFDEKYYRLENPEIKGSLIKHYYYTCYKNWCNPS